MHRATLAGALAVSALMIALPATAAPLPPAEVLVEAAQFLPPVVEVAPGGLVHFKSIEFGLHHQVIADDGTWGGHLMPGLTIPVGSEFSVAINKPSGTLVTYHCAFHALTMHGAILVV